MALNALTPSERSNAIAGWALVAVLSLGAVEGVLRGSLLWGGFSLLLALVASLPALATRSRTAMVPWPLLFCAAAAIVARAVGLYPEVAGYVAIATLAFLVVVELDLYTSVELGRRFAVGFGVLTTMALEALWIVAQFYSDRWLGTEFLSTQTELQEDIVLVTLVGFAVGAVFYWYFDRFDPAETVRRSGNGVDSR
ncbi:hypothetical protein [Halogeometricum limi]|uniref:Uncharacterized protein n=1 Tax=Halogeometricum limi TaxID=555875 RepID=A0A1I6I3A9_9EURY|nr:hypothetical protein [Halogeometricum limi]SFR61149.1 hypothetical protein SAMN04488124_2760 [Halogeometricum limi]